MYMNCKQLIGLQSNVFVDKVAFPHGKQLNHREETQ